MIEKERKNKRKRNDLSVQLWKLEKVNTKKVEEKIIEIDEMESKVNS